MCSICSTCQNSCFVLDYRPLELVLFCSVRKGCVSEKIKEESEPWNQRWKNRIYTKLALSSPQVFGCLIPVDLFMSPWSVSLKNKM